MNTSKQVNAMVVILFLTLLVTGAYTVWDPFRSDDAAEAQLEQAANRGAETFALNCRLCHGDRGQGGVDGGRLPAAAKLDKSRLRGFRDGEFVSAALDDDQILVTNVISCGRAGTQMPTWAETQGGTLNEEQIRQLMVLITEGLSEGFWHLAQEHADEIDAEATGHATVQQPGGALSASDTELVVNNAGPFSVEQYIRIDAERIQITAIPGTGQQLVEDIGRTPKRFLVSGAAGVEIGQIIRLDGELMEVTAIRDDGEPQIALDFDVSSSATRISVDDPSFFRSDYSFRVGDELIRAFEPVTTGQTLFETVGRAETYLSVSGTQGIAVGSVIRLDDELLRVTEILQPAQIEVERAADGESALSHGAGTSILRAEAEEGEELDTGQSLVAAVAASDTTFAVTAMGGLALDKLFALDGEIVRIVGITPAELRVERGVEGTSRAAHSRRASLFERNLLEVERGFEGTQAAEHSDGDTILMTELEVKRAVQGSSTGNHSKSADLFLGHRLIVARGKLDTDPAEHANGVTVFNFPVAPVGAEINEEACGQFRSAQPTPSGPTPTPIPGAVNVAVSLVEFSVDLDLSSVPSGPVAFQVSNDGSIDHNFQVIRTDLAVDALPQSDNKVDETADALEIVGRISDFGAGGSQTAQFLELVPGSYVLICNVPGHYDGGMRVGFTVTTP